MTAAFGYPYLLQLIGFLAWDSAWAANSDHVADDMVEESIALAIPVLGDQVNQPELAALPHSQLNSLHAMAAGMDSTDPDGTDGAFPEQIRDVAAELGRTTTSVSTARAALINRDIIHGPAGVRSPSGCHIYVSTSTVRVGPWKCPSATAPHHDRRGVL